MRDETVHVLLLEDDTNHAELVAALLDRYGSSQFRLHTEATLAGGIARLNRERINLVLLDLNLPDARGLATLEQFQRHSDVIPIIILTGHGDESLAMQAIQAGAQDYLSKERLDGTSLVRSVLFAIARTTAENMRALRRENAVLEASLRRLEVRRSEIELVAEMADLLHTCLTEDEAYRVVSQMAARLFPGGSGALFIALQGTATMAAVCHWGEVLPADHILEASKCWALRAGQALETKESCEEQFCSHLCSGTPGWSFCVPIMAQGETLGLFHVWRKSFSKDEASSVESGDLSAESWKRLSATIARQVALALGNLKLRRVLQAQSIRDPLTGLFNRRYMEESLDRELRRAARSERPLSAILLDLDRFKEFNDSFGHEAGDQLLRAFSEFLQAHIRGEDIVCRYGGEEFVLILPEAPLDTSLRRAELLREAAGELRVPYRGRFLGPIRFSQGLAVYPEHGTSAREILRVADLALLRAKNAGRDAIVVGNPAAFEAGVHVPDPESSGSTLHRRLLD